MVTTVGTYVEARLTVHPGLLGLALMVSSPAQNQMGQSRVQIKI